METAIKVTAIPQWGAAMLTRPGESECGDRYVLQAFDGGVLAAVIDALGHGSEAAYVADAAGKILQQYAHDSPAALITRCHTRLRGTRGATISLASLDWRRSRMTWLGIGNVTGVLAKANGERRQRLRSMLVHGGVIGDHIPDLHPSTIDLNAEDVLIIASDGIRSDFADSAPLGGTPQQVAERILARSATRSDDAAVLVLRCDGNI